MIDPPTSTDASTDASIGASPVAWGADGVPRSPRFDDVYYSSAGGLAEARSVFLDGCGLPDAWAGRSRFVVGELGFGAGLNILALLDLWRRARPVGAHLHVFSVEAFPMPVGDARRALAVWSELADLTERLLAQWPRRARGFHRLAFVDLGVILDLAIMDAAEALDAWTGHADAWFLDGFSPSRNPQMWSAEVLAGVARRSAPGARIATFTVAGAVRRGLEAQGFQVEKKPGFAAKRERLEAWTPAAPRSLSAPAPSVAIVGGGIAGASLARAFQALGVRPLLVEAMAPGAGASGNAAALVMPRLDAGSGPIGALYAQALARAADLYDQTAAAVIARGAVQTEVEPKDAGRFDRIAQSDLFETGAVGRLTPAAVSARLDEATTAGGLGFRDARVVEPAMVLGDWLQTADCVIAAVAAIEPVGDGWRLVDGEGGEIARADIVCLACGLDAARLAPDLPLAALRGQVSMAAAAEPVAVIGGGYAIPTRQGLLFGATHDRDDASVEVRPEDHRRNLDLLATVLPALAARLDPTGLTGRASLRAVTPDFLPLAGPLAAPGLFVLSGLGSRGFCAAPLLAEHVAAQVLGAPSPLPAVLAEIVHPGRFAARRNRRLVRSAKVQVAAPT
jgi:tRNA 5-methylaminomethyl-2-thiouridine biosynthesis bifunctional protein